MTPLVARDKNSGRIDTSHGDSQDNAIVLSEGESSSPEVPDSYVQLPPQPLQPIVHDKKTAVPKTPATIHSSPPSRPAQTTNRPPAHLIDVEATKKSNIISFDRHGPRNQGSVSARKEKSTSSHRASVQPNALRSGSALSSEPKRQRAIPNAHSTTKVKPNAREVAGVASSTKAATDVSAALAGFSKARLSKATGRSDTPRPHDTPARSAELQALASVDEDGFVNIDDFEGPVISRHVPGSPSKAGREVVGLRTASWKAMPPPAAKIISPFAPTSRDPKKPPKATNSHSVTETSPQRLEASSKKPTEIAPPSKRASGSPPPDPRNVKRVRVTDDSMREVGNTVVSRKAKEAGPLSQSKVRKISRNASHGSQSVDIHGSPVPQGMVVEGQSTVLETFSQQAAISSDDLTLDAIVSRKETQPQLSKTSGNISRHSRSSNQPAGLASNAKPRPAPPEQQSMAITAHGHTIKGQLQVGDRSQDPNPNPFTSSDKLQYGLPHILSPSFVESLKELVDEHQGRQRSAKHRRLEDDPDKTLVEPSPPRRRPKRTRSPSSSSDDATPSLKESKSSNHDLGVWRRSLLPRQADLFDELVIISHWLVRHLVDVETAAANVADDYRRRGLQIVKELERKRASQYQESLLRLQANKKRFTKELDGCSQRLNKHIKQSAAVRKQRVRSEGETEGAIRGLQSLIAELS